MWSLIFKCRVVRAQLRPDLLKGPRTKKAKDPTKRMEDAVPTQTATEREVPPPKKSSPPSRQWRALRVMYDHTNIWRPQQNNKEER